MINNVLNINKTKRQFLKYSICIAISLFLVLMFNIMNVFAAMDDRELGEAYEDPYSISNAQNNALQSMGIRDYDTVKNHVDFYTPDGEKASTSYIQQVANEQNMNEYLVVKYKDDEESQKIGKVFGTNGAALQEYLDTQGSDYKQNLDKLVNIQEQMVGATTQLVTVDGQQGIQFDSASGQLVIIKGADLTKIINKGDADLLEDLRQQL